MRDEKAFGANVDNIHDYLFKTFGPEEEKLKTIRRNAEEAGLPAIHVSPFDGRLLTFFAKLIQARRVVEIGTLAGYSTLCLAKGMPEEGKIWTFEKSAEHATLARSHFKTWGYDSMITLIEGSALHNLYDSKNPPCDLVFIDANKSDYPKYLEWAVHNTRPGGLILADNTLAWGEIHTQSTDPNVKSLREYNSMAGHHPQLMTLMIPTGEGMTASIRL
jgi:predicted O-methyltransferase YrrM